MQFGRLSVSTADLTRSFGWDQYGALMQEDVHEFNKILCDALEEKMKARLAVFAGHYEPCILANVVLAYLQAHGAVERRLCAF